ncbi:MAG: BLUF domain-containing protein [Brevundimonas sp.]
MGKELHRVVLRSVARLHHDDVIGRDAIFRKSITNNIRDGVTGCLAQPDGHFVQVIEGVKGQVDSLLDRIRADDRHEQMTVLGRWTVSGRLFIGWAMARPDPTPMNDQAFRVCTRDGSGVQVTTVLLGLMGPGDHLYAVT